MAPPSLPYEMHEKLNPCSDLLCKNATLLPVFWWKYKCQPKVTDVAQPKCPILHHLASEPHQSVDALDNMISKRGQPRNGPTHPRGKGRKGDTHTPPKTLSPLLPLLPLLPRCDPLPPAVTSSPDATPLHMGNVTLQIVHLAPKPSHIYLAAFTFLFCFNTALYQVLFWPFNLINNRTYIFTQNQNVFSKLLQR